MSYLPIIVVAGFGVVLIVGLAVWLVLTLRRFQRLRAQFNQYLVDRADTLEGQSAEVRAALDLLRGTKTPHAPRTMGDEKSREARRA